MCFVYINSIEGFFTNESLVFKNENIHEKTDSNRFYSIDASPAVVPQ